MVNFRFFVTVMLLLGSAKLWAEQGNTYTIGIASPGDTVYGGSRAVFQAVILDEAEDTVDLYDIQDLLKFRWKANPDSLLESTSHNPDDPQFSLVPINTSGATIIVRLTISAEELDGFDEELTDSVSVYVLPERPSKVTIELADLVLDSFSSPFYEVFNLIGTTDTLPLNAVLRNDDDDFLGYADSAIWLVGGPNVLYPADKQWKRNLSAHSSDSGFVAVAYLRDTVLLTDTVRVLVHQMNRLDLFFVTDTGESRTAPQDWEAGNAAGMIVRLSTEQDVFQPPASLKVPVVVRNLSQVPEELKLDRWPYVTTTDSWQDHEEIRLGEPFELDFIDGVAEFELSLFRVPTLPDSVDQHRISIGLGRSEFNDTTESFSILPGPPGGMEIYSGDGALLEDTLWIRLSGESKDSTLVYKAKTDSVDIYGNPIERVRPAHWTLDPQLGTVEGHDSSVTFTLYLDHRSDAAGILKAEVDARTPVSVSKRINVIGWGAHLTGAETMDRDGNGLLDGVRLRFDRPISVVPDSLYIKTRAYFPGDGDRVDFLVSEHNMVSGTNNVVELFFDEFTGLFPADHQTDWRPLLSIRGLDGFADMSGFRTDDNVGPIIWYSAVDSLSDRFLVRIAFTETIDWFGTADSSGTASSTGVDTLEMAPTALLQLGVTGGNDTFVPKGQVLESVRRMLVGPNFVEFSLDSGTEIDSSHAFRIIPAADSILQDMHGNPAESHDWVRVIALSDAPLPGNQPGGPGNEPDPRDSTSTAATTEEYPEGACGDCGTGVWHALIPLVWLRVSGTLRKRKKKK